MKRKVKFICLLNINNKNVSIMNVRTSEFVSEGHPDKFCDQVADSILDEILKLSKGNKNNTKLIRTAIECLAKDNLLTVSGEVKMSEEVRGRLDVEKIAREVWDKVGYTHHGILSVIDNIKAQSPDIAEGAGSGTDFGGAGDQGIMVGYATNETIDMLPIEHVIVRDICKALRDSRLSGKLSWLRSDCKTQITLDGSQAKSIVVAAQHSEGVGNSEIREGVIRHAILPVLDKYKIKKPTDDRILINGTGRFVIGGTIGDAGVVGRKIVVDAYGPRVSVGGGAYSGKDFTKVDRSAAYMARHIAKNVVANKVSGAKECTVKLAYCIGQLQPEMLTAITDTGKDVSSFVKDRFPDLSPKFIIDYFEMYNPTKWSYYETASYGHYGRSNFPWERLV